MGGRDSYAATDDVWKRQRERSKHDEYDATATTIAIA